MFRRMTAPRLSNVEVRLESASTRLENLEMKLDKLEQRADTHFQWMVGMWVATVLTIVVTSVQLNLAIASIGR